MNIRRYVFAFLTGIFYFSMNPVFAGSRVSVTYGIPYKNTISNVEMHFKGPKQFKCSDSTFKHDPTPGYKKVCYKLSAAGSSIYTAPIVAKQNETFTVKAGEEWIVRYQPESKFQSGNPAQTFQAGTKVKCDNSTFSVDPWPGNKKACFGLNYKLLAHEGQTFTVPYENLPPVSSTGQSNSSGMPGVPITPKASAQGSLPSSSGHDPRQN